MNGVQHEFCSTARIITDLDGFVVGGVLQVVIVDADYGVANEELLGPVGSFSLEYFAYDDGHLVLPSALDGDA